MAAWMLRASPLRCPSRDALRFLRHRQLGGLLFFVAGSVIPPASEKAACGGLPEAATTGCSQRWTGGFQCGQRVVGRDTVNLLSRLPAASRKLVAMDRRSSREAVGGREAARSNAKQREAAQAIAPDWVRCRNGRNGLANCERVRQRIVDGAPTDWDKQVQRIADRGARDGMDDRLDSRPCAAGETAPDQARYAESSHGWGPQPGIMRG